MRQLILDTETTGLYPEKGDRIIEFAALEMIDRKPTGQYLHLYINPERLIDEAATKVHGITNADVEDKPTFKEVVNRIVEYIKDAELIIHNAKFDLAFLDYQFKENAYDLTSAYVKNVIDTLILARRKFPGAKSSLDALCDRFNVDRSKRDYHGALIDCYLLAEVYLNLTREQISLLEDEEHHHYLSSNIKKNFLPLDNLNLHLKVKEANNEELNAHASYLTVLNKITHGKCAWYNLDKQS